MASIIIELNQQLAMVSAGFAVFVSILGNGCVQCKGLNIMQKRVKWGRMLSGVFVL